ncbi:MAG: hypothetical protein ACI89E_000322 [Planctomycetota bacterium]|jgi:hypothetical protein
MQTHKRPHWREDFTEARHAFDEWRSDRKRGARIPDHLWELAAKLAEEHSVAKAAVALKLDYYSVKRKLGRTSPKTSVPKGPSFVEMTLPVSEPDLSCTLEIFGPLEPGPKLRLELQGIGVTDLGLLIRSVWSGGF